MNRTIGKANIDIFSQTLFNLAEKDKNVIVVTSDSRGSGKLVSFGEKFPDQIIEVGIAEQNLVGIAAGLASTGKKVFAVSPACFLTARALEQIKNDVCYSDIPVKLIGISAGVSYGALGSTHHSLFDVAVLRAINNITILSPADNLETEQAIKFAYHIDKPVYIRLGKKPMAHLHSADSKYIAGKASRLCRGTDILFVATGETVFHALEAAEQLKKMDITSTVLSLHTIKPLDEETILKETKECKVVVTVEEHSINGGLGEATASLLLQNRVYVPFKIIGIPDEYTVTGSQNEVFQHYGISEHGLVQTVLSMLK